jgi:phage tail sheath gpL-like
VGLVAVNSVATALQAQTITSYEKAAAAFGNGGSEDMTEMIRLALKNGACGVVAVAIESEADYEKGFAVLEGVEDVSIMLCGSTDVKVQQLLRESVVNASAARRERIAVVAGGAGESVEKLVARAKELNSERVVLTAPGCVDKTGQSLTGLCVAAAVAGAIAGETDPAVPLGGGELSGLSGLDGRYEDNDLDLLILGGVTPVESVGGAISVVRGVTTRTTTGETADSTWRELSTIRIVDNVIPSLRSALRSKFRRAKNTERGRSAVRAQVVLELENKVAREIITGYEDVAVTADSEDPTRCLVEFSFTVAHGLNQIWLNAHITV